MNLVRALLGLLFAASLVPSGAYAYESPGIPDGYVSDFADILSSETQQNLERELAAYEASTTIEIAVVTVPSLGGDDIASYANMLGREWGIGQKGADNGVLLLVAPLDREVRIEVGYGLEGAIPDVTAGRVIDDLMLPAFREDDYDTGIRTAVVAIKDLADGEAFPEPPQTNDDGFDFFAITIAAIVFGLNLLSAFAAILARSKSWWLGGMMGALGGGVAGFFFAALSGAFAGALLLGVIGAAFDYVVSRSYRKYKDTGAPPPWYLGGTSGFGRGSGGGGFGGGSFGGGGASRSW